LTKVVPYQGGACPAVAGWLCAVCYIDWFNQHRPHQGLYGATPLEIYEGVTPANIKARYEPRKQWPINSGCAAPNLSNAIAARAFC
jgi:hypothetical protein